MEDLIIVLSALALMILLHELLHLLTALALKVKIKAFGISVIGPVFILNPKGLIEYKDKLILVYLTPMTLSLILLFHWNLFTIIFSFSNLAGSIGDLYFLIRLIMIKDVDERLKYSNSLEEKFKRISRLKYLGSQQ